MIKRRLMSGDVLRILFADGVGFDVWAEKYANPPQVFFEGKALPIERLDDVLARIDGYLKESGVKFTWNGKVPSKRDTAL